MTDDHPRRAERLLAPAAFATALGNNVQLIAGALLMIREERTMMAVGWLFIAVAAPQAVLSPYFGRLADRFDRRRLWIGCDVMSAGLALALPLWLVSGGATGVGVYGANFALAVVAALFFPASGALIKERVPAAKLRRFNASYEMATQAGMLLSATVGGLAVQAFGAVPLLVFNAVTFGVSAVCVAAVGRKPSTVGASRAVPVQAEGTRTAEVPMLRVILLYAQGSVVVTVFNALLPKFVLGELGHGPGAFGAVDALGSLGFLAATAAYRWAARRHPDLRIAIAGFLVTDVFLVLQPHFGLAGLFVGVPLGAFLFGQARIASRGLLLATVDEKGAGRAFGLANGLGLAATIAAMLLVAAITDHTDTRYGFAAIAALGAAATVGASLVGRRIASPAPVEQPVAA
ncbi:MFS transporter [Streptomyces sp. NPDC051940]|uniref:MFS transporter n=1 Tax=Streptomyces sp. NPDC051940 TaxID=3155675 RepID=UPI00342157CC